MSAVSVTRAFITGASGQDGSYLAELLLAKGYDVHVLVLGEGDEPLHPEITELLRRVTIHRGNVDDPGCLTKIIAVVQPTECYHLAARSAVRYEIEIERPTLATNVIGTLNLLSAVRAGAPECRVCLAGSSEMFGAPESTPQDENARRNPRSVYGISKLSAFELMRYYRGHLGLFAATAILYNHESPRRRPHFVSRKITLGLARILSGAASELVLGNLEARRDWGHARDYVNAMWRMLQQPQPSDFVIGTGELHSVRDFLERAFERAGLDWSRYVRVDSGLIREDSRIPLLSDSRKARRELQWEPSTTFNDLVDEMVDSDRRLIK
jgi:GDPmannose 4,6-dehydratase